MFSSSKAQRTIEKWQGMTIHDDTWNVLNMQHITPNLKRCDYPDISGGGKV